MMESTDGQKEIIFYKAYVCTCLYQSPYVHTILYIRTVTGTLHTEPTYDTKGHYGCNQSIESYLFRAYQELVFFVVCVMCVGRPHIRPFTTDFAPFLQALTRKLFQFLLS
jgi:hypothetical protein